MTQHIDAELLSLHNAMSSELFLPQYQAVYPAIIIIIYYYYINNTGGSKYPKTRFLNCENITSSQTVCPPTFGCL